VGALNGITSCWRRINTPHVPFLLAGAVFALLVLYATPANRGTDQFWYQSEVETLLAKQPPLSNIFYAGVYWRTHPQPSDNYFTHFTLVHYLVLPLSRMLGAHRGWIVSGLLVTLLGAICIARVVRQYTQSERFAIGAFCFFLFLPLTLWQAGNMLQESFVASWVAVVLYLYSLAFRRPAASWALGVAAALGVWVHPLFKVLVLLLPLYLAKRINNRSMLARIGPVAVAYGLGGGCLLLQPALFPNVGPQSLSAIIQASVPGGLPLAWYMAYDPEPLTFQFVTAKLLVALGGQVSMSVQGLSIYWPFNLMAMASVLLLVRVRMKEVRAVALLAILHLVLYGSIVVLHQNQQRYSLIATPPVMACAVIFLHRGAARISARWRRVGGGAIVVVFLGFLATDAAAVCKMRTSSVSATNDILVLQSWSAPIPQSDRMLYIMTGGTFQYQLVGYAVYPRSIMVLVEEQIPDSRTREVIDSFQPKWLIARATCRLEQSLSMGLVATELHRTNGWVLYRVAPAASSRPGIPAGGGQVLAVRAGPGAVSRGARRPARVDRPQPGESAGAVRVREQSFRRQRPADDRRSNARL